MEKNKGKLEGDMMQQLKEGGDEAKHEIRNTADILSDDFNFVTHIKMNITSGLQVLLVQELVQEQG